MTKEKINREEVKRIANELGLDEKSVYDTIDFQFKLISEEIKKPNTNSIRLQFLGLFRVKPRMVDSLINKIKERNDINKPLGKKE